MTAYNKGARGLSAQERDHSGSNAAPDDKADAVAKRNDIECAGLITRDPEQGYQSMQSRLVWPALLGVAVALLSGAVGWGLATERYELKSEILNLEKKQEREVAASQDRKTAIAAVEGENLSLVLQLQSLSRKHQAAIDKIRNLQLLSSDTTSEIVVDSSGHITPPDKTMKDGDADVAAPVNEPDISVSPEVNPVTDGLWFINFGTFQRVDVARTWSLRLREKGHSTVIHDIKNAERGNLYRVRVTNLPSRDVANVLASQLQEDYNLEPLWVEQEPNPP